MLHFRLPDKRKVFNKHLHGVPGYHNIFNFKAAMGVLSSLTEN
jgi:hypothetical protein